MVNFMQIIICTQAIDYLLREDPLTLESDFKYKNAVWSTNL